MKTLLTTFAILIFSTTIAFAEKPAPKKEADDSKPAAKEVEVPEALNFEVETLAGEKANLGDYTGKVVVIVNVASRCGATPQYAGLQKLHEDFNEAGLVVLGFPCNQFGKQEPGTAKDIQEFCTKKYSVSFPMYAKIDVNGDEATPLYKFLTSKETNPDFAGPIGWNFEKFVIGKDGKVVARFKTGIEPDEMVETIEKELKK